MNEQFLTYIWFQKLFSVTQKTVDGESVEIIDVGQPNTDGGPDVFNAKIKIGNTLWAGNVEFHQKSSDWIRHGHVTDEAYNSVILHVVLEVDVPILATDGRIIPQMKLSFPLNLYDNYTMLCVKRQFIACETAIHQVPELVLHSWLDRLLAERLEQKTAVITQMLEQSQHNWEEVFYVILARNFGFSTNALAFELLAKSLPLMVLAKHKSNLLQLEALLFGQAGMLHDDMCQDSYFLDLKREYNFLKAKYRLAPIDLSLWKLLRLRPANFPTIRLAQFAQLIYGSSKLFSKILETSDYKSLQLLFNCTPSSYWRTHYVFGKSADMKTLRLSKTSKNTLLINTVVPFLFCYGRLRNQFTYEERALDLLNEITAEKNSIVSGFAQCGVRVNSASDSQALIQLKRAYCDVHKCLQCRVAKFLMSENGKQEHSFICH